MTDPYFDTAMRTRYGAPFADIHRVDLQQALYQRALDLGVVFQLGQRVEGIDLEAAEITTASGVKARADLVVAADGLRSRCRDIFAPDGDGPRATGDLAYRIVLHVDDIDDAELRRWVRDVSCHFWIGPGAHAVGYSLRGGTVYNIVLLVPDDLPEGVDRQRGSVEQMKMLFKDWDPILGRFLGQVKDVDQWKLQYRKFSAFTALYVWKRQHLTGYRKRVSLMDKRQVESRLCVSPTLHAAVSAPATHDFTHVVETPATPCCPT